MERIPDRCTELGAEHQASDPHVAAAAIFPRPSPDKLLADARRVQEQRGEFRYGFLDPVHASRDARTYGMRIKSRGCHATTRKTATMTTQVFVKPGIAQAIGPITPADP